jgi:hypothetical protein
MKYIPFNDFRKYIREHWDQAYELTRLFPTHWLCQTGNFYQRFKSRLESLKNSFRIIELYMDVFGEDYNESSVREECRQAIKVMIPLYENKEKQFSTIRDDLIAKEGTFELLTTRLMRKAQKS